MGYATAKALSIYFGCSLRTAQRLIRRAPAEYKRLNADGVMCVWLGCVQAPYRRRGNPNFLKSDYQRAMRRRRG